MNDTRLKVVNALLDEARTLLVDIVDNGPATECMRDFNNIDSARVFINSAAVYVQAAYSGRVGELG